MAKRLRHVGITLSTTALWGASIIGIVLVFLVPTVEAENAVQIGTYATIGAIVRKGFIKAEAMINASLRLAEELALRRTSAGGPPDDGIAPVIPLPAPRGQHSEVS